jgi:hypothetical protein
VSQQPDVKNAELLEVVKYAYVWFIIIIII